MIAATLSGCGATGTVTYTGFPLKNKGLSAAAENGILKSVQAEVVPPGEQCANGGVKLVSTGNTSEAPVYVCSQAEERIYRVKNTDVSALPATGPLALCSNDAETGCLASGNFKVLNSTQLDATKIAVGTTVAGVVGAAVFESHSACAANGVGATGACYTTDAYKSFDYVGLTAGNIKSGVTIGGVAGTYSIAFNTFIGSGAHRDRTAPQMTYAEELGLEASVLWRTITSGNTGFGYREVPLIAKDDDGYFASSGSANPVTKITRPTEGTWGGSGSGARVVCGKSATSVATKITDCGTRNSSAATWNGVTNGIAGEGSWTLVTVYSSAGGDADGTTCGTGANTCYEVWRDDRTGLLWSDTLADTVGGSTNYNWCKATGSNFSSDTNNPYREDDPSDYCNSATYQNQTQSPAPVSLCFEDSDWLSTPTTADPMKGNMHKHDGGSATVKWRLPTKQDFAIADFNGLRHVLPNFATDFWSASVLSGDRSIAWLFYGVSGSVWADNRNVAYGVRCVARP